MSAKLKWGSFHEETQILMNEMRMQFAQCESIYVANKARLEHFEAAVAKLFDETDPDTIPKPEGAAEGSVTEDDGEEEASGAANNAGPLN